MIKDPYVYEETNVLKNISNIKDQTKLDNYETTMVNLGIIKLLKSNFKTNNGYDLDKYQYNYHQLNNKKSIDEFSE